MCCWHGRPGRRVGWLRSSAPSSGCCVCYSESRGEPVAGVARLGQGLGVLSAAHLQVARAREIRTAQVSSSGSVSTFEPAVRCLS